MKFYCAKRFSLGEIIQEEHELTGTTSFRISRVFIHEGENGLTFKRANLILNHSALTNNYGHKGPSEFSHSCPTFKKKHKCKRYFSSASTEALFKRCFDVLMRLICESFLVLTV